MLHHFRALKKTPKTMLLFLSFIFLIRNLLVQSDAASIKNLFENEIQNLKKIGFIRSKRADSGNYDYVDYDNSIEKGVGFEDDYVTDDEHASGEVDEDKILDLVLCGASGIMCK